MKNVLTSHVQKYTEYLEEVMEFFLSNSEEAT